MGNFLAIIGALGVVAALVMFAVRLIAKKGLGYKQLGILVVVSVLLFFVGAGIEGSSPEFQKKLEEKKKKQAEIAAEQAFETAKNDENMEDNKDIVPEIDFSDEETVETSPELQKRIEEKKKKRADSSAITEPNITGTEDTNIIEEEESRNLKTERNSNTLGKEDINLEIKAPEEESQISTMEPIKDEQPKTYKEWLQKVIEEEIGDSSNLSTPRIAGISFYENDESCPILSLIADDNITLNLVRVGMLSNATKIFKEIFADDKADIATIIWGRPVTDDYGNTAIAPVMAIAVSRETANKINWRDFSYSKLPNVADDFFEEPQSKW